MATESEEDLLCSAAGDGGVEPRGGGALDPDSSWLQQWSPPARPTTLSPREAALVPPTIVFVNSTLAAGHMRRAIAAAAPGLRVAELTSGVPPAARAARLVDFSAGAIRVLVATDLAARGLDAPRLAHVIQADLAGDAVAHLHRVGRTARAGKSGHATALVTRANLPLARAAAEAAAGGKALDSLFSSKRSFGKKIKRNVIAGKAAASASASVTVSVTGGGLVSTP